MIKAIRTIKNKCRKVVFVPWLCVCSASEVELSLLQEDCVLTEYKHVCV